VTAIEPTASYASLMGVICVNGDLGGARTRRKHHSHFPPLWDAFQTPRNEVRL
jgi:hypothetical protein